MRSLRLMPLLAACGCAVAPVRPADRALEDMTLLSALMFDQRGPDRLDAAGFQDCRIGAGRCAGFGETLIRPLAQLGEPFALHFFHDDRASESYREPLRAELPAGLSWRHTMEDVRRAWGPGRLVGGFGTDSVWRYRLGDFAFRFREPAPRPGQKAPPALETFSVSWEPLPDPEPSAARLRRTTPPATLAETLLDYAAAHRLVGAACEPEARSPLAKAVPQLTASTLKLRDCPVYPSYVFELRQADDYESLAAAYQGAEQWSLQRLLEDLASKRKLQSTRTWEVVVRGLELALDVRSRQLLEAVPSHKRMTRYGLCAALHGWGDGRCEKPTELTDALIPRVVTPAFSTVVPLLPLMRGLYARSTPAGPPVRVELGPMLLQGNDTPLGTSVRADTPQEVLVVQLQDEYWHLKERLDEANVVIDEAKTGRRFGCSVAGSGRQESCARGTPDELMLFFAARDEVSRAVPGYQRRLAEIEAQLLRLGASTQRRPYNAPAATRFQANGRFEYRRWYTQLVALVMPDGRRVSATARGPERLSTDPIDLSTVQRVDPTATVRELLLRLTVDRANQVAAALDPEEAAWLRHFVTGAPEPLRGSWGPAFDSRGR